MKKVFGVHLFLLLFFLSILGGNIYLYYEISADNNTHKELEREILRASSTLKAAYKKEKDFDAIEHRLGKVTSRLGFGQELQKINQYLKLQRVDFKITPEEVLASDLTTSTVTLQMVHGADQPLYSLISHIIDNYPGIIMPQQLILYRDGQSEVPLIKGAFTFEWVKKGQDSP